MKLVAAGECAAVKFDETTYLGNDAIADLRGDETDKEIFEMRPLDHGLKRILKQLGLKDINDLIPDK